ncbi:MAG: GNAT family N-acetyltransferase [Anaerolineales bacterium]
MSENLQIQIEGAPPIPGLTFRGFRGESDFPIMAEIITSANLADGEEQLVKAEQIQQSYSHLQRSDAGKDLLFFEENGNPLGYGRCMWDAESEGDHLYSFFIHMKAEGRDRGIGEAVGRYFMTRLIEYAAEHPAEVKKYYQTWGSSNQVWYGKLVEKLGFEPARYGISMLRSCSQPIEVTPLPEGIEVRPIHPEHYRPVWDASVEASRDHWGFVEHTEEDYKAWLNFPWFQPELWKVAWDGDQIVGMVCNFINHDDNEAFNRKRGYTENISVRRPWRRQGAARSLLTQSIQMFIEMGMEETALGVDTQNLSGALDLYQSVGYVEDKRFITYRKPLN